MKMIKLSSNILKYMVEQYITLGQDIFMFDNLKETFPGHTDDYLSNAIYYLQNEGFTTVSPGDNVAYITKLLPDGIRHCQDDTMLKKGYSVLKELKTLLG